MKTNQEIVIHDMEFDNQTGAFEEIKTESGLEESIKKVHEANLNKKSDNFSGSVKFFQEYNAILEKIKEERSKMNWKPEHVGIYFGEKDKYQF